MGNNRDKKILKTFGKNLKALRKAKDFTTRDFADRAEIAHSQVWRLENGLGDPSLTTLLAIARTLEVKLDKLIPPEE